VIEKGNKLWWQGKSHNQANCDFLELFFIFFFSYFATIASFCSLQTIDVS